MSTENIMTETYQMRYTDLRARLVARLDADSDLPHSVSDRNGA
jgi:hypothetical protein